MNIRTVLRRSGVIFFSVGLCLISSHTVLAADAVIAGPSHAKAGDTVMLHGKHFNAGDTFTLSIQRGSQQSEELVTADAEGQLEYALHTGAAGKYLLQIRDSNNKVIASSLVTVRANGG